MTTALITGVNGQAGSVLTEILLNRGYKVVGTKRRSSTKTTWRLKNFLEHDNFFLENADITDFVSLFNVFKKYQPNKCFNTAAMSFVAESFRQPLLTWDVTGKGVLNVLEVIRSLELGCKFIQFSSSEIFGNSYDTKHARVMEDHQEGVATQLYQHENTRFSPRSPYGVAKLAGYHITKVYRESYGMWASNAILFNYESYARGVEFVTKKISRYIGQLKYYLDHSATKDSPPILHLGNIYSRRDWGYAKDHMEGVYKLSQQPKPEDFVFATGQTHSVEEFLQEAFKNIGIDNYEPYVKIDENLYRPSEVDYLKGDYSKAKEKLGWEPKTSFKELVKIMVDEDIKRAKSKRELDEFKKKVQI